MMVDIVSPMAMTAKPNHSYCTISFARPYDLKIGTIALRLQSVRPTMFLGVPRKITSDQENLRSHFLF